MNNRYSITIEGEGVRIARQISPEELRRVLNVVLSEEQYENEAMKAGDFLEGSAQLGN